MSQGSPILSGVESLPAVVDTPIRKEGGSTTAIRAITGGHRAHEGRIYINHSLPIDTVVYSRFNGNGCQFSAVCL